MKTSLRVPRRRFLRGLGTVLALPVFESLVPARVWAQELKAPAGTSKLFPRRLVYTYSPNGMDMVRWWPKDRQTGTDYEMGPILQSLQPYKNDLLMVSGLAQDNGSAHGDGGGDHARATATYLTGARPLKNPSILRVGVSVDQLLAQNIGDRTRIPSLELSCDSHGPAGKCDDAYSCALQFNLSWRSASEPTPAEVNPRTVFERLFGTGGPPNESDEARAKRMLYNKSVLDFVLDDAHGLQNSLGVADREKLDQYLTAVREVERRIATTTSLPSEVLAQARGYDYDPDLTLEQAAKFNPHFAELARSMFDLQVLAMQSDQTRLIVFSYGHDGQNRPYPQVGITEGHHDLSHHMNQQAKKDKIAVINTYLVSLFAEFVGKLKAVEEGGPGRTLLDNSIVVLGSSISDGNRHDHTDLPILIAGHGGGALKTGQHIDFGTTSKTPLNNLHATFCDLMGCPLTVGSHFGDATGEIQDVLA